MKDLLLARRRLHEKDLLPAMRRLHDDATCVIRCGHPGRTPACFAFLAMSHLRQCFAFLAISHLRQWFASWVMPPASFGAVIRAVHLKSDLRNHQAIVQPRPRVVRLLDGYADHS